MKKFAFVLNTAGLFGGAEKRFSSLFQFLNKYFPDSAYFFVSGELYTSLKHHCPDSNFNNLIVLKSLGNSIAGIKKSFRSKKRIDQEREIFSNTIPLLYYPLYKGIIQYFKNCFKQYYLFRQIEKVRREKNIEVFIAVFSGILPLYFYLNKKKNKPAVIFSDMDSWFSNINESNKNFWYKKFDSFNYGLEHSNSIDFLSPYILDGILKKGIKLDNNSINIAPCSFTDYSKCVPGEKKAFLISYAARIFPDKNPMLYLEAARTIIARYPFVRFNLLGDGLTWLKKEITDFIEKNKLKDNIYFGFHPNPPELFSESTIFVSVQSDNNYPSQSVLEAMACENAIIASDVGDTRLFINDKVGILVPLNRQSLIDALEKLISNKETTLQMGRNAREFVLKNHTIEKCAKYYIDLINKTKVEDA